MSADWRILRNKKTDAIILDRVRMCTSFWCHFRGLQLAPPLPDNQGLLFVTDDEGTGSKAIHMFFMRFSIGVVWLDANGRVVDKKLAKPWRPYYAPSKPAQYYLEASIKILDCVDIGDELRFDEETT
jgi:uncharacterized membrane protein (UPF0127 family)